MKGWLGAYQYRAYIRYSIIDRKINKAVGTVEIFGGPLDGERSEFGVLRIDVRHEYENEEALAELLGIADSFFFDVNTEKFLIKAIPEATARIRALEKSGYLPYPAGGLEREHYFVKLSPDRET